MTYRVYGDRGKPVVAFPTSQAHDNQWEDFGMVEALADFIDDGDIQLFAMDSIDDDTFFRPDGKRRKAMQRYEQWLAYINKEFLPTVTARGQKAMLTGCSMGAYHAANLFFRSPEQVDSVIALSGVYSPAPFLGFKGHMKRDARANSPLDYLQLPIDDEKRAHYQGSRLVFCAGQGPGEEEMLADTVALAEVLEDQDIDAWVDVWGEDAVHDWPWWHEQMRYFMAEVLTDEDRERQSQERERRAQSMKRNAKQAKRGYRPGVTPLAKAAK